MKDERLNYWRELCIAAAFEDNPQNLPELITQINRHMMERQEELADRVFERMSLDFPPVAGKHWIQ